MLQPTLERPAAMPLRPSGPVPPESTPGTVRKRHLRSIAAIALAPFAVLVLRATHASWTATGDYSLIELRARDVGTASTPLVGPYSRFGWNHPGPALFYAFAAPYRLFASHGTGLLAGAALVGAVSTIAIVVVVIRRSPTLLVAAFGLLLFAGMVRTLGAGFLWDPWNPYVIVLPFLAFLCFSWWAATGEARALPFAIGFGSFVVQTHVSLGLEVVAVSLLALGWLMLIHHDAAERRRLRRAQRVSLIVLAVMWVPPVVQQFLPGGGNIGELLRFWTQSHRNTVGLVRAARMIAPEFALPAPWLTRTDHVVPVSGALAAPHFSFPFALVALAIASLLAWRRRDGFALATCSVAVTAAAGSWITCSRIVGVPFPYLVVWSHVIGPLCWFTAAVVVLPLFAERLRPVTITWLTRAVAAGAVILLVLVTAWSFTTSAPDPIDNHAASTLFASMLPELRRLPAPLLVESEFGYSSNAIMGGLVASSVEHGVDARYSSHVRIMAGNAHIVNPGSAGTDVYIVINGEVAAYSRDPHWRRIGLYDSLTRADRTELNQLVAAVNRATADDELPAYTAGLRPTRTRR
jgi:hypothetical protein